MWGRWVLLSLVTMCIANTVTQERLLEPLRERCGGKETWSGYLVSCPYCFSHYIAFALVPLFDLRLLHVPYDWGPAVAVIDWFFNSLLVVILAAFIRLFFYTVDETVGLFRRHEKRTEIEIKRVDPDADLEPSAG
ncbi:MAG TPA: hypothetical protein VHF22_14345 [Planctomycetota bacterium]|nr:hypothetical protein [Planctomycetota bacterium]